MSAKVQVQTTINNEPVEFLCEPRQSLLECLRDVVGLTGTKEGCGDGNCGSCTVLGVEANGESITTVEGLAHGNTLHPLQKAFLEHAALQCGICTPGFLIAADALLQKHPQPTEEQTRFWLANNLCRCTGYDKIIRAVQAAAHEINANSGAAQ
jgi:carbon-monoxide dehydrogenase small subunit